MDTPSATTTLAVDSGGESIPICNATFVEKMLFAAPLST